MVQKIKSVLCSGTKLNLFWVPPKNPFPKNPPEPIAILGGEGCILHTYILNLHR